MRGQAGFQCGNVRHLWHNTDRVSHMQSGSPQVRPVRYVVLALCALVLLFAAKVKVSQYSGSSSHGPNPVAASKLWLNGQKMELSAATTLQPVVCLAFLTFVSILLAAPQRPKPFAAAPSPRPLSRFERHRFLRPPPAV